MSERRLLRAGRLLAWSSPGLLALAALVAIGAGEAGSGWLGPLLVGLVVGSLAAGVAGAILCASAGSFGRALIAAAIPVAFGLLYIVAALTVDETDWRKF